jgi:hypothetical protein
MTESTPSPGYETRDVNPSFVLVVATLFLMAAAGFALVLFGTYQAALPPTGVNGVGPPPQLPGDPPLADRIRAVPTPRLDPLERGSDSTTQRPEDLRADRQPRLHGYAWVERGKVARIPIDRAMDAVVATQRANPPAKKEGGR